MTKTQKTLKIIGGKFRGMKLEMLDSPLTRPTKAILKESLFNTLQNDIQGALLIEGFGGSGSIGLEALSRGCQETIFIENNPQALKILQANIQKLQNTHPTLQAKTFLGDSLLLLPQIIQTTKLPTILYLDPPFCIREGMQNIYEACFALVAELKNPLLFLVIFEHLSTYEMPKTLGNFCIIQQKKFGKSSLSYYIKETN